VNTPGQDESLLIAELRHRLANTFQLLQAIIHIRLRRVDDPESQRHLAWLLDVVTALGMLQQRVGVAGPTDFGAYLGEAASYWRRVCESASIRITLDVDPIQVGETEAATLALIAHELISNAIEHAFPGEQAGTILVRFKRGPDGGRELIVKDDGRGLPEVDRDDRGQGLGLVRGLAEHLGGRVKLENADGVTVRVQVPPNSEAKPN